MDDNVNDTLTSTKRTDSKICGVCGDKALGYNFNAVTCESCKAFFRRNALKKKDFKCPFNENCKVDVITRRFCQKCRLKKCFDIGMKKEWIMTDEEKKIKKQKIEENRHKRQLEIQQQRHQYHHSFVASPSPVACEDTSDKIIIPLSGSKLSIKSENTSLTAHNNEQSGLSSVADKNNEGPPAKAVRLSEELTDVHSTSPLSDLSECESVQSPESSGAGTCKDSFSPLSSVTSQPSPEFTSSNFSPVSPIVCNNPNEYKLSLSQSSSSSSSSCSESKGSACNGQYMKSHFIFQDTVNQVLTVAIKSEFNGGKNVASTSKVNYSRELTDLEHAKLNELIVANKAMKNPVNDDPRVTTAADPSLLNVINMTDIAIRRLIKMSKKISGFKNLCQEDQIALLKGGCTELMILRSVMTYDPEKDCWQGPKTFCIKLEVLREAKGNIYEEHKRFIQSFDPNWRSDENIMLILSAITLFNPDRSNIIHKDVIKLEQDSYYFLLRRYLESVYHGCEARSMYIKLLRKMEELHILNENHVRVFLDVNPKDVEPLLIEIFDLKNH